MGLDMTLVRKTYVKQWSFDKPEDTFTVTVQRGGKAYDAIKPEHITYIEEEVARWRKVNAIHRWFVENVQGGKDDCKEYSVERDELETLLDLCKRVVKASKLVQGRIHVSTTYAASSGVRENYEDGKVIKNPQIAMELLPTQEGFFFGSTDYDQDYLDDINDTINKLNAVLAEEDIGTLYYSSSW